jgi:hypothetical protein
MTNFIQNGQSTQVAWVGANIVGHAFDPATGDIDDTEGFGAFDSIAKTNVIGVRVMDIGGGSEDVNSVYVAHRYLIDRVVYDPYKRSQDHNEKVLSEAALRPFGSAFSVGVLNVISERIDRLEHIRLSQKVLKVGGKVFFKIWPGNHSGIGGATASGYQNNREPETYLEEIKSIFGRNNVFFDVEQKTIIGTNMIDRYPSGSVSI